VLRISAAKGGTSVLADAFLAQPWLTEEEIRFAFAGACCCNWGDDLQDVREISHAVPSRSSRRRPPRARRWMSWCCNCCIFSRNIADRMDPCRHGTASLKDLLRMSWRSLILMAVANAPAFFTPAFLANSKLLRLPLRLSPCAQPEAHRSQSLYAFVFDAFCRFRH